MTEPEPLPVDRLAVQRLRGQVDRIARGLGVDVEATRQIVEKVVADMPDRDDNERLMEARKRLLIATEQQQAVDPALSCSKGDLQSAGAMPELWRWAAWQPPVSIQIYG
jgi:hypothetical protein